MCLCRFEKRGPLLCRSIFFGLQMASSSMIPELVQTESSLRRSSSILLIRILLRLVVLERVPREHAAFDKLKHFASVGQ